MNCPKCGALKKRVTELTKLVAMLMPPCCFLCHAADCPAILNEGFSSNRPANCPAAKALEEKS